MTDLNWLPAFLIMGASGIAGWLLALRGRDGELLPLPDHRTDLLKRKEALYDALRDLSGPADFVAAERLRLETEAASVLRELDTMADAPKPAAPSTRGPSFGERHPQLVGALGGGAVVLFGGALYYGLSEYSTPQPTPQAAVEQEVQDELASLKAEVDKNPSDIAARNRYTRALLGADRAMEAFEQTQETTKLDPENTEARTYQAVILMAIGDFAMSAQLLDKVLSKDPNYVEALGYRGVLYLRANDPENAIATWEKAIAVDPAQEQFLRPLILRAQAGPTAAMPGAATSGAAMSGAGMSGAATSGAATPSGASAATGPGLSGEVRLADGAKVPTGATLFVFARAAGVERGPPVAVKKLPATGFPLTFTLGPEDSPMGGGLSGEMVLTAKIDADGNPTSKSPEDLEGKSSPVTVGATGIVITVGAAGG